MNAGHRTYTETLTAPHRQRVDREQLIARGHQRANQQTAVGLEADHNLCWILDVFAQQRVQFTDPLRAVIDASAHLHVPCSSSTTTS
jgi:hypothetical protein